MGRVGSAVYRQLTEECGYKTLGVEHDPNRIRDLVRQGFQIIEGDATDYDFWTRVVTGSGVKMILLALPAQYANIEALRELQRIGHGGAVVASVALYREDVAELTELGTDVVIRLYAGAGEALADRAVEAVLARENDDAPPPAVAAKPDRFDRHMLGTREMRVRDDARLPDG
ncbi:NAD-binding protein [Gordonia alkaliphila]|uniref:NAD-binding protein n=1 Tax=Gordonia alkaliphila TaxID=1053547 RepID=UPI001FF42687|nr:NAD-binding protein [Gordonia alkaliphila]MCK0440596.1 NAD-binding protein [Gordonia alkaliphila]